jgi:uncharacterized membrane protein
MQVNTLEDLFSHPGFICIFLVILVTIGNILVGVSILPMDERKKRYRLHRYTYWVAVAGFCLFMWLQYNDSGNSPYSIFVFIYFLTVIPWSRKINVTGHAILSCIGLVLLTLVAFLMI